MPDIVTIGAFLSSVKNATDIAKAIRSADSSLERAEMKLKMADLLESLADAKIQAVEIQELVAEKDKRIAELQSAFGFKGKLVRDCDAYYEMGADGAPTGAPYCSRCWEVDQKLVHVTEFSHHESHCGSCKTPYRRLRVPNYQK